LPASSRTQPTGTDGESWPEPVGSIDIGSNTIRVLVVRIVDGAPVRLLDTGAFARLGEGVHQTGRLDECRMDAALDLISGYAADARRAGAAMLVPFCTAAVRHAENGAEFARRVSEAAVAPARVLSGEDEARWAYLGATSALRVSGEALVLDIGGGSIELVAGRGGRVISAQSCPVGSRNLSGALPQCMRPMVTSGVVRFVAAVGGVLDDHDVKRAAWPGEVVIGTGGTFTVLAALAQDMDTYDAERVQGYELTWADVRVVLGRAAAVEVEERGRILRVDPDRADVIVPGAALALAVMERLRVSRVIVDTYGVRLGAILAGVEQEASV